MPRVFGGAPKCANCEKSVYAAEELKALQKIWHKMCFKCTHCSKKLTPGMETEHNDKPYCKNCYGKHYGPKGVGGGATAGCLTTDTEDNAVSKFKNTHESKNTVSITAQEKCYTCEKTVYAAEKLVVLNKVFHKPCVKCKACSKTMTPGEVLEHDDEIYCKTCYAQDFGPHGKV
ncbi:cysteine-rich protein 2-like [Bolinopsis microptera]|uniref:cysteine-rich protein 2-like n=1 Tax=Bolinopsis microptera TaxID=2820187 RepID=UPI003079B384